MVVPLSVLKGVFGAAAEDGAAHRGAEIGIEHAAAVDDSAASDRAAFDNLRSAAAYHGSCCRAPADDILLAADIGAHGQPARLHLLDAEASTVVPLAVPKGLTDCVPPLLTVVPTSCPSTSSNPPFWTTVPLAEPEPWTSTVPKTVVLMIVPPRKTVRPPPKSTTSPVSVWPEETL